MQSDGSRPAAWMRGDSGAREECLVAPNLHDYSVRAMVNILRWPDEFTDATPIVDLGVEFGEFLQQMNTAGATVLAEECWSSFALRREERMVDFIRRGRLRHGFPQCWEVCLTHHGKGVPLGPEFGLRECACVVVSGLDAIRPVTEAWLDGSDIDAILHVATFWDRTNTIDPLEPPTSVS